MALRVIHDRFLTAVHHLPSGVTNYQRSFHPLFLIHCVLQCLVRVLMSFNHKIRPQIGSPLTQLFMSKRSTSLSNLWSNKATNSRQAKSKNLQSQESSLHQQRTNVPTQKLRATTSILIPMGRRLLVASGNI